MTTEHPFAVYIRTLGKGRQGSRALTEDEAYQAMRMILAGDITPEQLGAFLMLMRVKEEEPQEVAGFVRAVREYLAIPDDRPAVDLDWSSYAGKRRQLPWFLLSTLALAAAGVTVFMHGASGHTAGRIYTKDVLAALGAPVSKTMNEACEQLRTQRFTYMDIEHLCSPLHRIIELRPFLGLRSPVHTISRLIIQGIFHPGYRPTHQQAAQLLGQSHMAVIKGEGGEIERNPDVDCLVQSVHDDCLEDEIWPAMFTRRHVKDETMDIRRLVQVWRGELDDEYALASITGTLAVTLKMMGRAQDQTEAQALAESLWNSRPRNQLTDCAYRCGSA
jgi:anthranilate phosphoribosyltransferase